MSIRFQIGGVSTVIPGVYDQFRIANSLPAPAPAGRSVVILGEAEEGVPGSELDLRLNFFTSPAEVKDFYKAGPIVDAAAMLFSNQPSPAFPGSIARLYVYKTNASLRAERTISSPSNFGDLVAARYGEAGNLIKTQIVDAQSETLPTITFGYLPSPVSKSFKVSVSGVVSSALTVGADLTASTLQPLLNALTGVSATGGVAKTDITAAMDVNLTATDDTLTITKSAGAGLFDASIAANDIAYIAPGSDLAGTADANAGAYLVVSVSTTVLVLKQLKHVVAAGEANIAAFDLTSPVSLAAAGQILIDSPITMTFDGTTPAGAGSTLEILEANASKLGHGMLYKSDSLVNMLNSGTSAIANISVTVPSAGKLKAALDTGAWVVIPKVGDIVQISKGSLIAGATNLNVGSFIVESANSQNVTLAHLFSGLTTEAVASQPLAGENDALKTTPSFVSSEIAARRIDSATERKVRVEASRQSDGVALPDNSIGGRNVLEIGYYNAAATAASLSIDAQRNLTITPVGSGLNAIVVPLNKYKSLQELITFLNTRSGVSAKIANTAFNSAPTSVLDAVSNISCLSGHALSAHNARIKRDWNDWTQFFEDSFGLLAFRVGSIALKAGLPAAEALPSFLDGAVIGATSSASVQAGLDAALKVDVRMVIPLFSRDASKDALDGLTDNGSTYDIESIHAGVRGHVATASSTLFRKERFGMLSFYGSFADSKQKASDVSSERTQMTFQLHNATDGQGELRRFLPWMSACAAAAGRAQAILGASLLRKPFLLSSAEHIGDTSLFSDSLVPDFDPDDQGQLTEAIEAGLLTFKAVTGFGVRVESPDLSTRSRELDPEAWVYERVSVLFVADEVRQTIRSVLENFIGQRQSDVPTAVVFTAIQNALSVFNVGTGNGSLIASKVNSVRREGTTYLASVSIQPVEALEAILVDVSADRNLA